MRKFVANYLVSDTGVFLKNGMAVVGEDGFVDQYIDTADNLKELEQLIFHNGIVMADFQFTKIIASQPIPLDENPFQPFVLQAVGESTQWTIHQLIELGKTLQLQFPEMKIPVIMDEITKILLTEGRFVKETIPGIYLLTGVDLAGLHFKPTSRLKKIL